MRMPKTRREYELDLLNAFRSGLEYAPILDHDNLTRDENNAVRNYAKMHEFKTDAVEKCIINIV